MDPTRRKFLLHTARAGTRACRARTPARAPRASASCAAPAPPRPCPRATRISPTRPWRCSRAGCARALTSERLTGIYLERIRRLDPRLLSVITRTEEFALHQARAADKEFAAGEVLRPPARHPLGAKDLVDTAGIPTTYGAEPFRDRVPAKDAVSVERLHKAGAVLVAKLSLGALALNDVWFGGETKNPWLPEEGSSGSSAGPGAATAAGLVGFSLGSETDGSIIAPAMRCGVVGLRPTFGGGRAPAP